jgi:Tfp pilus assembly protein PilN
MANINLAATSYENDRRASNFNNGLLIIVTILIILAITYVWVYFSANNAANKTKMANEQYNTQYQKFIGSTNKDVLDFQNRITIAKDLMNQQKLGYGILPAVENAMVRGVYFKLFDFDQTKNSIEVEGISENFDMLAQQIRSFKQSTFFSGVTTGTAGLDENGKVSFELNLSINK